MQQKDAFLKFLKEKEFSGTKEDHHRYISKYYANEFGPRRDEILKIVELGVRGGSDVKIFSAWFSKSEIVGIDINEIIKPDKDGSCNIDFKDLDNFLFIKGDGYCRNIVGKFKNKSIDYLIDDASHQVHDQIKSLERYYPKIKDDGKIIIEDIGYVGSPRRIKKYNLSIEKSFEIARDQLIETAKRLNLEYKIYDLRNEHEESTHFSALMEFYKK